jgi:uncharacterized membrane protein YqjE
MTLFATAGRIGATLVAMAGTRLELAAIEFQEDARRLLGHLAWTLLAVFLAAGALLLAALFVIAVFWDTYRLQAVGGMAVLFGALAAIMFCYAMALGIDLVCGWMLGLRWWFVAGVAVAAGMALYHYTLIKARDRMKCFAAFRHNKWLGAALFAGVALDYAFG